MKTKYVSEHHTPSQIWISLHIFTNDTKLIVRYAFKTCMDGIITKGKALKNKEFCSKSFTLKEANLLTWGWTNLQITKIYAEKNCNLRSSEPFYHVEQDIIIVSKLDTMVFVFNKNYRAEGLLFTEFLLFLWLASLNIGKGEFGGSSSLTLYLIAWHDIT